MERLMRTLGHLEPAGVAGRGAATALFEVLEKEDRFVLVADVPGVARKDLTVTVDAAPGEHGEAGRRVLTIAGERRAADPDSARKGSFSRSVWLPRNVDDARVAAKMQDGVLVLTLPKKRPPPAAANTRRVQVE